MKISLNVARQEFHSISLEGSKLKDLYDKLGELFEFGVSQNDIIHWNNIVTRYPKDLSTLNEDLMQYGDLANAKKHLDSNMESLKLEHGQLTAKVAALRKEGKRISRSIAFEVSQARRLVHIFLKDLVAKISESNNAADQALKTMKQQSLSIGEQTVKALQTLDAKTRQELDIIQKIATAEFSPLIKAARGQHVDLEELKASVIRAMGIMHSRLNYMQNGGTKDILQKAIVKLESEMIVP